MVGVNTIKTDNPLLTTRLEEKKGINPKRVVLDTTLSIPEDANVLHNDYPSDTIIITGNSVPSDKKERLEKIGARIVNVKLDGNRIDLNALMNLLGKMRITSLLIEGGSRVAASALKAGIVDKICFFYAPKILGGNDGVPMLRGAGPELMKHSIAVKDITVRQFDDDVMMEGYIYSCSPESLKDLEP
jgi:diaminohydroxyphosphoribosylaminopyrimidine deaminase/5-amino-6-(5-phosphoribosylamino)uracil reductase